MHEQLEDGYFASQKSCREINKCFNQDLNFFQLF